MVLEAFPELKEDLQKKKELFFEDDDINPKELIKEYFLKAESTQGAILFTVARGNFSEGIDFKDCRARAVFIIGIPFLNLKDPKINC